MFSTEVWVTTRCANIQQRIRKKKNINKNKMIKTLLNLRKMNCVGTLLLALIGLSAARSGLYSEESPSSVRIEKCHQECIKKVNIWLVMICSIAESNWSVRSWNSTTMITNLVKYSLVMKQKTQMLMHHDIQNTLFILCDLDIAKTYIHWISRKGKRRRFQNLWGYKFYKSING